MADYKVTITSDRTDDVKREVERRCDKFLKEVGIHISGEAAFALGADPRRIDTGLLQNSITYALSGQKAAITSYRANNPDKTGIIRSGTYKGTAPDDPDNKKAVYIGSNVDYAAHVHEGTSHMDPNRYLKNAFEWNDDQIKEKLEEAFEDL